MSISIRGNKVEVKSRYNREFARYMREIGAEWDRDRRVWVADASMAEEIKRKMDEYGLLGRQPRKQAYSDNPPVYIRLSRRNRNVLVIKYGDTVIVANVNDVRQLLDGKREYVRARRLS